MTDCMHTDCWLRWNNICCIPGDHWCPLYKTHEQWVNWCVERTKQKYKEL